MRSRKYHATVSCSAFILLATLYGIATGASLDLLRVAFWSAAGIACYVALSYLFGFDPYRTRLNQFASDLLQYVDRWELRLGQATLSMLGCIVLSAKLLDESHFVLAVVSGTLSAWTYFAWRLSAGGYHGDQARAH